MEAILILKIFAMAAVVLVIGIGLEKAIRWGEREGIVQRGPVEDKHVEFHEGDRVEVIGKVDGMDLSGKEATVIAVEAGDEFSVCVEFDEPIVEGHSGFGRGKDGCCRWGRAREFRKI